MRLIVVHALSFRSMCTLCDHESIGELVEGLRKTFNTNALTFAGLWLLWLMLSSHFKACNHEPEEG